MKKARYTRFQIAEPCSEKLSEMHPLPGGHHCEKCERTVVDFREMSDHETIRLYQQRQGRVCGIFRPDQLNRGMALPQPLKEGKPWAAIVTLTSSLLLGNVEAEGQLCRLPPAPQMVDFQVDGPASFDAKKKLIVGRVTDEKGEPLIGANIILPNFSGTVSDVDGSFSINIPEGQKEIEIKVSYLGFVGQTLLAKNGRALEIKLKEDVVSLPLAEVTGRKVTSYSISTLGMLGEYAGPKQLNDDVLAKETSPVETPIEINVFPNPFASSVSVETTLENDAALLFHLYNEAGQLVFADTRDLMAGPQNIFLDLQKRELLNGIYFLRISDEKGEIRTKKLVKMR